MKASRGKVVRMHYVLRDDAGSVLDSSRNGRPLEYLHGRGNIVPGLERALEGAEAGHAAKVVVAPKDGYGDRDPEQVFLAARGQFPPDMKLRKGMEVHADSPEGPVTFTVVEVRPDGAVLDGNHPLAGKTLHFDLEVMEIRDATREELDHGHVHGEGHHH